MTRDDLVKGEWLSKKLNEFEGLLKALEKFEHKNEEVNLYLKFYHGYSYCESGQIHVPLKNAIAFLKNEKEKIEREFSSL